MPNAPLQAAGHDGVAQSASGDLFYKPTDPEEVNFYATVNNDDRHQDLLDIIPQFYGTLTEGDLAGEYGNKQHGAGGSNSTRSDSPDTPVTKKKKKNMIVVLKNSLYGFSQPCILDIKLGHILWDERADPEKQARLDGVAATTTSGSLDARLTGMNIFYEGQPDESVNRDIQKEQDARLGITDRITTPKGERVVFGKIYGRTLSKETFSDGLLRYFFRDEADGFRRGNLSEIQREFYGYLLYYFVNRLKQIRDLLNSKDFVMRGGSLLFIYEGLQSSVDVKLQVLHKLQELEAEQEESENFDESKLENILDEIKQQLDALSVSDKRDNIAPEESEEDDDEFSSDDIQARLFKLELIDFAHTQLFDDGRGPDPGVIRGLDNLINVFEGYLNDLEKQ